MDWEHYAIYSGVIVSGGVAITWWLTHRIRVTQRKLTRNIESVKRFEAVSTNSPVDDPTAMARERGLESIATRFTLVRRIFLPAVLLFTLALLVLPLLESVNAVYISLLVAVVAVVVSIAARPLLENLFAGIVLSFSQPVRIGDTVKVDEHYGTVEDISITHVTIKIWDWRRYMVPHSLMLNREFINYSLVDRYQWAHVEFWVAPESDLDQVRAIAEAAPKDSSHFAGHEDPRFWVMEMGKEGIRCWVAAWANTPFAAWQLKHDTHMELIRRFRDAGIRTHVHRVEWQSDGGPFASGGSKTHS